MVDLTIIVVGIRVKKWESLYKEAKTAIKRYEHEFLFVGPNPLPSFFDDKEDVVYLRTFSNPSICLQMVSQLARGKFMTWIIDDASIKENSLDSALDVMKNQDKTTIMFSRYVERENGIEKEDLENFMNANFHQDLRLPLVDKSFKIAPVMLLQTDFFKEMGGISCSYEHINRFNFRF